MTPIFIGVRIDMYLKKKLKKVAAMLFLISLIIIVYHEFLLRNSGYYLTNRFNDPNYIQIIVPQPLPTDYPINTIEVNQIPFAQLKELATNNSEHPIFKKVATKYEIVYNGNQISHLQVSPDQQKVGFYKFFSDETGYERVALVIMDIDTKSFEEIKDENDNFSNWEWRDNEIVDIGINCGSGCHYTQVTSVKNGQIVAQYFKGKKFQF